MTSHSKELGMPTQLHNFVRFVRLSRKLTQQEFAKLLKYNTQGKFYISKVERGEQKLPMDFLARLNKHLNIHEAEQLQEIISAFVLKGNKR